MTKTNLEVIQLSNKENHLNRGGFFYLSITKQSMVEKQEIYGVRAIIECIEAKQSIEKVWLVKRTS